MARRMAVARANERHHDGQRHVKTFEDLAGHGYGFAGHGLLQVLSVA